MSVFRFKKFSVRNERSAMKVNTDGVLLGAATTVLPSDRRVLDVGTGTGTVALMIAQRLEVECSGADWHIQTLTHRRRRKRPRISISPLGGIILSL